MCTMFFKLGLVPFSSWLPDTFEGASYPIGAYMSSIPVLACFAVLSRILMTFLHYTYTIKIVLALIAVITIFLGSLSLIRQENLKKNYGLFYECAIGYNTARVVRIFRIQPFKCIVLFVLLSFCKYRCVGKAIILLYNSAKLENLDELKGVIYHRPYYVIAFTVILIALAGLAPTCGFVAKMYIFSAVARSGFIFLPFLITALLASVILIYGYWRIIRAMFRRIETDIVIDTSVISSKFILYACAAATVIICLLRISL